MTRLTAKSSTIFVATGNKTKVYHSMSEVPPELRRKLDDSTRGTHSATILIADRRGREELVKALQGEESSLQPRVARNRVLQRAPEPESLHEKKRFPIRAALEILLPVMVGVFVWIYIATRY